MRSSRSSRTPPPPPRSFCSPPSYGSPCTPVAGRGPRTEARTRLQPQIAELRKKHAKSPERMQKALMELHAKEKVSPLSGCLPSLLQMPAFFLLYHVFSSQKIGDDPNSLLGHQLFQAPRRALARRARRRRVFGAQGLVYLGLAAIVIAVATFNYGRTKRQLAANPMTPAAGPDGQPMPGMGAMTKLMPLMSFMTLFSVAFVPLAAALYIVTSTTWTAIERACLYRDVPASGTALATAL
ncbi:membrane protein insertase YidC [Streptomyces sp. M10(2022)]